MSEISGAEVLLEAQELEPQYLGVIRPADIMPEQDKKKLLGDPWLATEVHVLARQTDGATEFTAVFEHQPMGGFSFTNFLNNVSPSRFDMSRAGILGDWDLPDRLDEDDWMASYYQRLQAVHGFKTAPDSVQPTSEIGSLVMDGKTVVSGFGRFFMEFTDGARRNFMYVVADQPPEGVEQTVRLTRGVVPREKLKARAMHAFHNPESIEHIELLADELGLPEFQPTVEDLLANHPKFAKLRRGFAHFEPGKIYDELFQGNRTRVKRDVFRLYRRNLTALQVDSLFEYMIHKDNMPVPSACSQNAPKYYIRRLDEYSLERVRKEVGELGHTQEFLVLKAADNGQEADSPPDIELPIEGSLEYKDKSKKFIRAVLKWRVGNDGRTEWINDEPAVIDDDSSQEYDSSLFGLMVLAYLNPELRDDKRIWQPTMKLPGGKREQDISAVQVPVLALMHKKRIMKHPIVTEAMRLAA